MFETICAWNYLLLFRIVADWIHLSALTCRQFRLKVAPFPPIEITSNYQNQSWYLAVVEHSCQPCKFSENFENCSAIYQSQFLLISHLVHEILHLNNVYQILYTTCVMISLINTYCVKFTHTLCRLLHILCIFVCNFWHFEAFMRLCCKFSIVPINTFLCKI